MHVPIDLRDCRRLASNMKMNGRSALEVHTVCDKQKWLLDDIVNADIKC